MAVFTATFVDQTFDRKSAEVNYIARVLRNMADTLQRSQGMVSTSTPVLDLNQAGTPNTQVASYTYTASASNP